MERWSCQDHWNESERFHRNNLNIWSFCTYLIFMAFSHKPVRCSARTATMKCHYLELTAEKVCIFIPPVRMKYSPRRRAAPAWCGLLTVINPGVYRAGFERVSPTQGSLSGRKRSFTIRAQRGGLALSFFTSLLLQHQSQSLQKKSCWSCFSRCSQPIAGVWGMIVPELSSFRQVIWCGSWRTRKVN